MKLSELKIQDKIIAVNLANADLANLNLIVGPNGIGKTTLLSKIKKAVKGEAVHVAVFLINSNDYDLTDLMEVARKTREPLNEALSSIMEKHEVFIKSFEPNLKALSFLEGKIVVAISGSDDPIYLDNMSKGFQRIIEILLNCHYLYDGILLIDNIENSIDYSKRYDLLNIIVNSAETQRNQVFMTTYSQDITESFSEISLKPLPGNYCVTFMLIRMGLSIKKSNKGELIATAFDQKTLESMLSMGIRLT